MTGEPWSDERLAAAFRARFGGPAPVGLAGDTVSAVRSGRPTRMRVSSGSRLGWLGIAAVVAVVAVVGTGFALRFGLYPGGGTVTDGPPGLKTFTYGEIAFDFPAEWSLRDASVPFSGGSVIAVVGTLPVDPACGLGHVDINCYYEQRLEPGTISIVVGTGAYRGGTIFDPERAAPPTIRTTIAGMPALFTDRGRPAESYYLSDLDLTWEIAQPSTPSSVYRIDVGIRGPGVDDYRRQAEALAASFRFVNPVTTIPTDPATAREVGRAAIDEAESGDRAMWELGPDVPSWYSCFGDEPDTSSDGLVATSPGGHLDPPVFAVCRWTIAPEGSAFWRLSLATDWSIGGRDGRVIETRWLAADGSAAASSFEGDFPLTTDVETPPPPPAGEPDFSVELDDAANRVTVAEVHDDSGLLVTVRSARPDDLDPILDLADGAASIGPNPPGRPNELVIQWYGGPCDLAHTFELRGRARTITMQDRTTGSCRLPAIQRGLVLEFSEPVPAGEVTITRLQSTGSFTIADVDELGHQVTFDFADDSGLLVDARATAAGEPIPVGPDPGPDHAFVSNPAGESAEIRVIWSGSPCDSAWSLHIGEDARLITIAHPPRPACDAVGVGRDLILVFAEAVSAGEMTAVIDEVIVLPD
jgi:hypothetical protein